MSRASQAAHDTSRDAAADAEHAPDLDAEHSPETSRRASLAGLRRDAAAQRRAGGATDASADSILLGAAHGSSDATPAEQADQHRMAEQYSSPAVKAALNLGAVRLKDYAFSIQTMAKSDPGDGGPVRTVELMKHLFEEARADLTRLRVEHGIQSAGSQRAHWEEASRLRDAFGRFFMAWMTAQHYASQHHLKLDDDKIRNPFHLKQELDTIVTRTGIGPGDERRASVDERSPTEILRKALEENLEAALECARSVRMGATGNPTVALQDLTKMIWQLKEIQAAIGPGIDSKIVSAFRPKVVKLVQNVSALQQEVADKPDLHQKMINNNVVNVIGHIKHVFHVGAS